MPPLEQQTTKPAISVADLKERVGEVIGVSGWMRIDQDLIDAFASVSGDHQFIHVDPERAAAETPFGGTIAHGFLVLSLISRMRQEAVPPLANVRMGINYGFEKIRFISPVLSGSRVRGRFRLEAVDERGPHEFQFNWGVTVDLDGAHKPALVAEWLTRAIVSPNETI